MSSPSGGWRTKWIECSYQRCSSRCRCGFMRKIRMFWRCNYYSWNGNYCLVSLWRMCRYRSKIHIFYPIEVAHVNFHFQYCTDLWLHFLHLLIKNSKHLAPFNLKSEHFLAWRKKSWSIDQKSQKCIFDRDCKSILTVINAEIACP